ncbi:hypothetical protein D3C75_886850 [compost metagenome]
MAIKFTDLRTTALIIRGHLKLTGDFRHNVVFNSLVVVRHVAFGVAVVIAFAHLQRVQTQVAGNVIHNLFDGDHALRPAKTPIRRIRRQICAAAITRNTRIPEVIGVIGVKHRPIADRS